MKRINRSRDPAQNIRVFCLGGVSMGVGGGGGEGGGRVFCIDERRSY